MAKLRPSYIFLSPIVLFPVILILHTSKYHGTVVVGHMKTIHKVYELVQV